MFMALGQEYSASPAAMPEQSALSPVIVIGFVGGFISHDNPVHSGVQLAARLRKDYPSGVYVRVFENRRSEDAHREILRLLDTNHDGKLSPDEKQRARIIIFGHSWGGSETVALARKLQGEGIPVLLTIQVDSVAKLGEDDSLIPANVAHAANFYQSNGLLHGRSEIHAADPSHTQIIGNFRFDYASNSVQCHGYPWFSQVFEEPHIEIECDPNVVKHVESLIRSKLPQPPPGSATR
jgi:pimeloyl-ACP methyl ester carboxylesterase